MLHSHRRDGCKIVIKLIVCKSLLRFIFLLLSTTSSIGYGWCGCADAFLRFGG
jgi:hypothetical protein